MTLQLSYSQPWLHIRTSWRIRKVLVPSRAVNHKETWVQSIPGTGNNSQGKGHEVGTILVYSRNSK